MAAALNSPPESPPGQRTRALAFEYSSIPYSEDFHNELCEHVLEPEIHGVVTGTAIAVPGTKGRPKEDSVKVQQIDPSTLPQVDPSELPLGMDDRRRKYESPVAGVLLTHPGGWFEGSAPYQDLAQLHSDRDLEAARQLVAEHGISTRSAWKSTVTRLIRDETRRLETSMKERAETIEANQALERDLKQLEVQREMERKIEEKMRAGAKRMKLG